MHLHRCSCRIQVRRREGRRGEGRGGYRRRDISSFFQPLPVE
jgi:hypothetical protein